MNDKVEIANAGISGFHCFECKRRNAKVVKVTTESYEVSETVWKVDKRTEKEYPAYVTHWEECDYLWFECPDCGYTWEEWDDED